VPIAPDDDEKKRREAIKFTKADAETLDAARSLMGQYVLAIATAADSMFKADPSLRQARGGTFKIPDRPFKGQELVVEAGMESGMHVYEGQGATRHEIFTIKTLYARIGDSTFAPTMHTFEMNRYAFRLVSKVGGLKKRD
jgi:hypothetical protein